MQANGIPTARYGSFTELEPALEYVHELGAPVVVKADGLAAGKGVVVADTIEVAEDAVRSCFDGAFGSAGSKVLVEECLTGPECSLLAFVSGGKAHCMATAQDHKRAFDGDRGPNTGGMGVYSPVPIVTDKELADMTHMMKVAAAATAREPFKNDYRGVLYGGFMLTPEGPKVLEYNARFGDPETQVVLPRLKTDLVDVMMAVAEGRPDDIDLRWSEQWAVCVVLASAGYPGAYEKGKVILGIDDAEGHGWRDGVPCWHRPQRRWRARHRRRPCTERGCAGQDVRRSPREGLRGLRRHQLRGQAAALRHRREGCCRPRSLGVRPRLSCTRSEAFVEII